MSAACEVFAFTPRALARQAAALGAWRLTSRLVNVWFPARPDRRGSTYLDRKHRPCAASQPSEVFARLNCIFGSYGKSAPGRAAAPPPHRAAATAGRRLPRAPSAAPPRGGAGRACAARPARPRRPSAGRRAGKQRLAPAVFAPSRIVHAMSRFPDRERKGSRRRTQCRQVKVLPQALTALRLGTDRTLWSALIWPRAADPIIG